MVINGIVALTDLLMKNITMPGKTVPSAAAPESVDSGAAPKLPDRLRDRLCVKHYRIRTEHCLSVLRQALHSFSRQAPS